MKAARLTQILSTFMVLSCLCAAAKADDAEWYALARKATCAELADAYKTTSAAERKAAAALKDSKDGTIATNVLGLASFAIIGFGMFTWNDNASAQENLDDLRNDLKIIRTVAAEKKCSLT